MIVKFIDYCNGHRYSDPEKTFVQVETSLSPKDLREAMKKAERSISTSTWLGGDWIKILKALQLPYTKIISDKPVLKSDLDYKLIVGSY